MCECTSLTGKRAARDSVGVKMLKRDDARSGTESTLVLNLRAIIPFSPTENTEGAGTQGPCTLACPTQHVAQRRLKWSVLFNCTAETLRSVKARQICNIPSRSSLLRHTQFNGAAKRNRLWPIGIGKVSSTRRPRTDVRFAPPFPFYSHR